MTKHLTLNLYFGYTRVLVGKTLIFILNISFLQILAFLVQWFLRGFFKHPATTNFIFDEQLIANYHSGVSLQNTGAETFYDCTILKHFGPIPKETETRKFPFYSLSPKDAKYLIWLILDHQFQRSQKQGQHKVNASFSL